MPPKPVNKSTPVVKPVTKPVPKIVSVNRSAPLATSLTTPPKPGDAGGVKEEENPIMNALSLITNALKQQVNPEELKKKDDEIADLKKQIEDLKVDLYVQKCELEEKKTTNYTYFKLNKELSDKLESYALTAYDKKPEPTAVKAMEERMTQAPAFDYKPGKRQIPEKEKSSPPAPKKKCLPATKKPRAQILSSEDEDERETNADILFGDNNDDIFSDELELLSGKKD